MTLVRRMELGKVCGQDRKTIKPGECQELRYIGLETIEANTGKFLDCELSKTPEIPQANSFRFNHRHVLYGKLRPYLNKVALPTFEGKCSTEIIPLLPNSELERAYLAYFLRSPHIVEQITVKTAGSRMPRADMDFVLGLEIPLPPIEEQRRLVDILTRAESIVRLRREALKKTQEIIPALFLDMFGDPATNPKGWAKANINSVAEVSYGIADKIDTNITEVDGVRLITISNVTIDGGIDESVRRYCYVTDRAREKASVQKGDLLFNWRNGSEEHIGKTAIWESTDEAFHVSFLLRLRPNQDKVLSNYLWVMLNLLRASGYFIAQSRQQVNRKFNASELSALKIPVPPIDLQNKFSENLKSIRFIQSQATRCLVTAEATFQALLHRAFAGAL